MSIPQTYTPQTGSRNSRVALFILGGLALVVALLVIGGIGLVRSTMNVSREAAGAAGRFLDVLQAHNYKTAYGLLTPQAQAATPASSMADIQNLLEKRRGPATGHSGPTNWFVSSYNGVTSVRLAYQERFQKGDVPVTLVLTRTPDGWRVMSYNFQF